MIITGNKKGGWFIPFLGILLLLFLNAADLFAGALKIKELGKITAAYYSDVFINGNYAYCTDRTGLEILDIKKPSNPKPIGRYKSPGTASGVEVRNNYAFIADGLQGLQVVDVSNPANPVRVGNWNSIGSADDDIISIFVRGNYTYAVSRRLLVFDTSIPSKPTLVGTFKYENPSCDDNPEECDVYPKDVFVTSRYAYLVDFSLGLWVVDLSDTSSPQPAAYIDIPANIYEIRVSGNYAYLAAGRNGMQVMDISNPTGPVTVANYYGPEYHDTRGVFISGTRAYVTYGDQMDIVDISSPWAPVRTARYTGCFANKVFARGNYAYVANEYKVNFTVLDVSDPYSPVKVAELDKPDELRSIALKDNYAYLSDRLNRLWVIDIADAAKPFIAGKYISLDEEYNVAVRGNYAYLTGRYRIDNGITYGRLKVMNISNPGSPVLVGQCTTPSIPTGIFLNGNYAYLSEGESNILAVMDISNPAAPVNVGNYVQTGTDDSARGVFVKGNYAYLAYGDNGLYILDISTPSNPKLSGKYRKDGDTVMAVTVRDNYAYLSNYYNGLVILDITDPTQPKPVGRFKISSGCNFEAVLVGDYAYLLSDDSGIYAIDISNPSSPSLACNYGDYDTLGWGQDLIAGGKKLYAATNSGFYILGVQTVASTVTLTVQSTPFTGVAVTVAPPDINGKGNGVTDFTRSYTPGTVVTLTAPEYQRKNFTKWMLDGVDRTARRNLKVAMNGNHTARACYEDAASPVITLNRSRFDFGVKLPAVQGVQTGAQSFAIVNSGEGVLHWSAIPSQSWLQVEPGSGSGNAIVQVSIDAVSLSPGTYTGDITISDPAVANSPQTVKVILKVFQDTTPPSGSFDTPVDGSVVQGSIPVTGWALDDIGIANVKIYRDGNDSLVYIGDALFVEGARPDIEIAFPDYPNNYKAGWGYMLLTNSLPGGGNGTYTLTAKATDREGNEITLGTKTITIDNAHAVKPFGAIDTPIQGGTVSGNKFINNGWVLTPQSNMIPVDGSTIDVVIDGVVKGHPRYNIFRSDIAALFPGYANTDGASGYYYIDTTKLTNGVHTIAWTATDSAGNSDGIGSRYFTVQDFNKSFDQTFSKVWPPAGLNSRRGAPACAPVLDETKIVEIKELERVEINLSGAGVFEGYLVVGDQLRGLPIGSTLDRENGVFYWQPGASFVGEYRLVFIGKDDEGRNTRKHIVVNIKPK